MVDEFDAAATEGSACDDSIRDKYIDCGRIVSTVLGTLVEQVKVGAKVLDLCNIGDSLLHDKLHAIYHKKKADGEAIPRGIAYPTCINVNEHVRNFCPLEDDSTELKAGDVVSIELGGHIDGFVASAATTVVLGGAKGKTADAIRAAALAAEAAARAIVPGTTNAEVAAIINNVVAAHGCQLVASMASHELKQHVIDGAKCVLPRPAAEERQAPCTFALNEVYAINVFVSTGEGKAREMPDNRPGVYKREISVSAQPKSNAGRALVEEINRKYPCLPFPARSVGEQKTRRMALADAVRSGSLMAIPALTERPAAIVAHFGLTIMLTQKIRVVARVEPLKEGIQCDKQVDADIAKLIAQPIERKAPAATKLGATAVKKA